MGRVPADSGPVSEPRCTGVCPAGPIRHRIRTCHDGSSAVRGHPPFHPQRHHRVDVLPRGAAVAQRCVRHPKGPGQRTSPLRWPGPLGSYSTRPRARWLTGARIADMPSPGVREPGPGWRGGESSRIRAGQLLKRVNLAAGSNQRAPVSHLISAASSRRTDASRSSRMPAVRPSTRIRASSERNRPGLTFTGYASANSSSYNPRTFGLAKTAPFALWYHRRPRGLGGAASPVSGSPGGRQAATACLLNRPGLIGAVHRAAFPAKGAAKSGPGRARAADRDPRSPRCRLR